jgi:hypothetical protein
VEQIESLKIGGQKEFHGAYKSTAVEGAASQEADTEICGGFASSHFAAIFRMSPLGFIGLISDLLDDRRKGFLKFLEMAPDDRSRQSLNFRVVAQPIPNGWDYLFRIIAMGPQHPCRWGQW